MTAVEAVLSIDTLKNVREKVHQKNNQPPQMHVASRGTQPLRLNQLFQVQFAPPPLPFTVHTFVLLRQTYPADSSLSCNVSSFESRPRQMGGVGGWGVSYHGDIMVYFAYISAELPPLFRTGPASVCRTREGDWRGGGCILMWWRGRLHCVIQFPDYFYRLHFLVGCSRPCGEVGRQNETKRKE